MQKALSCFAAIRAVFGLAETARAHGGIPCGLYTDDLRISMIREDGGTIETSMKQIAERSKGPLKANAHPPTRWVVDKQAHADKIQEAVTRDCEWGGGSRVGGD